VLHRPITFTNAGVGHDYVCQTVQCAMLKMIVHVTALHRVRSSLQHNELTCHADIEADVMQAFLCLLSTCDCYSEADSV